jgi:glycine/D-amino acid oxidase-like deaminating enzyme/nitrite reductase/ring-hydroxylating ferredoxin subunit
MAEWRESSFPYYEHPAESSTESVWKHNAEHLGTERTYRTDFPPLHEHVMADVTIIGAGITGLTAALLLQKAGYDVVVLDAHPVAYGVTGFNSGHLTSMLLDMKFQNVIAAFGEDATRAVALGLDEAIALIERNVRDYRIECDFRRVPGYLYAEKTSQVRALQEDYEAASVAGLQVTRTFNVPLPFNVEEGIHVANQAIFNPLKYVQALALQFVEQGGRIYENSRVATIEHDTKANRMTITAEHGSVASQEAVVATHTPIGFRPALQTRLEPMRSYIIGIRTESSPVGDAIFWDMDEPYHYIRHAQDEHGPLLIVGGEDHKTGEQEHTERCFRNLEQYARERFHVTSVDYQWSAQFYDPADGLPYIGKMSDVYVATGYSGEGLTFGTLAGHLIAEQIQGLHNDLTEILNPGRTKPLASLGGFLSENIGTMAHFVKDRLKKPAYTHPAQVPLGEGAIVQVEGQKVAVYHGEEGVLHCMSPVCTHMHCLVNWNSAEKSWDCPCHGGRFDATGKVLNGPPVTDLQPIDLPQ